MQLPSQFCSSRLGCRVKFSLETCLARAGLAKYMKHTCRENSVGESVAISALETQILCRHQKRKCSASSYHKARLIYILLVTYLVR